MGVEHEMVVREFLGDLEGVELDATKIERVINRMSTNAEYRIVAWQDPLVGRDAIRTELLRQATVCRDVVIEILAIGSVGNLVFTERVDSMSLRGKPLSGHIAGVFEVDTDGNISAWRDYLDTAEVTLQMKSPHEAARPPG